MLLSLTVLTWYEGARGHDVAGAERTFRDLRSNLGTFDAPSASVAYFDWLAWLLLIALIVVGLVANLPTPAANPLRVLGLFLGMVGSAATYYALFVYFEDIRERGGTGDVFQNARWGLWFALTGYALAGVGAAVGPMRGKSQDAV